MPNGDLLDSTIEELVEKVQGLAAVASQPQVQSVAALAARLTIELSSEVNGLTGNVHVAKQQIVQRLNSLTEVLDKTQSELANASEESSKHSQALVKWTKALVFFTAMYTLITGGLLLATLLSG